MHASAQPSVDEVAQMRLTVLKQVVTVVEHIDGVVYLRQVSNLDQASVGTQQRYQHQRLISRRDVAQVPDCRTNFGHGSDHEAVGEEDKDGGEVGVVHRDGDHYVQLDELRDER